jgi:AraC-like DNA-binding protein
MTPADIAFETGDSSHARTNGGSDAGSMSLTWQDLAAASKALTGCELTIPLVAHLVRPKPELMSRLLTLHKTAGELAKTASGILAHTEVARSLEQALVRAMIMCLADGVPALPAATGRRHSVVIARLEEFLAANWDRAIYLAELCAATGASERTLRLCCQEHLGMGPIRYLQLRRLHLARRALMRARSGATTVTEIATEFGFWELGRFSVEYRALFGETPSVTLYRAPDDYWTTKNHSLALPVPEFA